MGAVPSLMRRRSLGLLAGLSLTAATGVAAQPKKAGGGDSMRPAKPRVALVLGSGAARGFAHIGVIKALDAAGIRPDLIVGSSVGALVGAFYAAGYTGLQMEEFALKVKDGDIIDLSSGAKGRMVIGESLQNLVNQAVRERTIEKLPVPLVVVATQLRNGEATAFRSGNVGLVVRASCSVPGVFMPPKINDVEYVDGALASPVAVRTAREAGADLVIAVDVSSAPLNATPVGTYEQVMHGFEIMGRSLARIEAAQADIVIRPELGRMSGTDFGARSEFMQFGQAAGARFVPVVREKIAQWRGVARSS